MGFEYAAFLHLRWAQPDRDRPFKVPGGWFGALVVVGLPAACALGAIVTAGWQVIVGGIGAEVVIVGAFYVRAALRRRGLCVDKRKSAYTSLDDPVHAPLKD
jgi:hypothetical protein